MPSKSNNPLTRIKENVMGTDAENAQAEKDIAKYNKFTRGADAAQSWTTNLENKGTSDAINIDTYGKPSSSKQVDSAKFVEKALDAADNEKARERTRGVSTGMKKGGIVKRSIDGCAVRGKTRAK